MRNSAISQILRPTKTDAGGGPETGMQVGMALAEEFAREFGGAYCICAATCAQRDLFSSRRAVPSRAIGRRKRGLASLRLVREHKCFETHRFHYY